MLVHVFSFSVSITCLVYRQLRSCAGFIVTAMPARNVLRMFLIAGIGVTAASVSPPTSAAEWSMTPSVRLGYEWNDNISLTLQPHNTVHGSTIAPMLNMGAQSEIWKIMGSAQVARKRYSGQTGLDQDIERFGITSSYRMERSSFALNASRINDTTLADDPEDPDLGRVTVQRSRRTESIQPAWNWSITERSQLQLSYQLSETSYAGGESIGLFDYRNQVAMVTWSYMLSPRSQFSLKGNYSRFRVPDRDLQSQVPTTLVPSFTVVSSVESNTPGYSAGIYHAFSETMQGTLTLGRRKTSTERNVINCDFVLVPQPGYGCEPDSQQTDDAGATFSGDLRKQFEKLSLVARASRDVAASGVGTVTETDLLNIRLEYPYTPRLRGLLTMNASHARQIVNVSSLAANIKLYAIQPALHWNWTREADLGVTYGYRHLERENEDQAATSNAIYLSFAYTWPKFSISR